MNNVKRKELIPKLVTFATSTKKCTLRPKKLQFWSTLSQTLPKVMLFAYLFSLKPFIGFFVYDSWLANGCPAFPSFNCTAIQKCIVKKILLSDSKKRKKNLGVIHKWRHSCFDMLVTLISMKSRQKFLEPLPKIVPSFMGVL